MGATVVSVKTTTKWTTRVVPALILLVTVYSVYAVVARFCIQYILIKRGERGLAIALLVLLFFFLGLSVTTYLRTFLTVKHNAGLVPLPPRPTSTGATNTTADTAGVHEKPPTGTSYGGLPDDNPDSPGLETFYSRDVFVCESDGRPKWCAMCRNWKPDRAHHSSELERCVYKMDHFCPWVGGMVAETSYKYFTQFVVYASCYLAVCLSVGVYALVHQRDETGRLESNALAVVVLASFFGFFSMVMAITAVRLVLLNITNIDSLRREKVMQLAVRVALDTPTNDKFHTVTYPLPHASAIPSFLPPPTQNSLRRTRSPPRTPQTLGASETSSQGGQGTQGAQSAQDVPPDAATSHGINNGVPLETLGSRDRLARRTFAVLRTNPNENPWNLGLYGNWKAVMGDRPIDWFLPIKPSPCSRHDDDMRSLYPMGVVLERVKQRYGLTSPTA
jgi:palmitoyltransferase